MRHQSIFVLTCKKDSKAFLKKQTLKRSSVFITKRENTFAIVNSLPNNKILDWFEFKAFADDKKHVNQKLKFNLRRMENTVGNRENPGYQHFLLFPRFQRLLSQSH